MRFIDLRIFDSNDIYRPHPGPQENMQIGGVRCAISQIWSKFREMLGEIRLTSTFDLRLLDISFSVARRTRRPDIFPHMRDVGGRKKDLTL